MLIQTQTQMRAIPIEFLHDTREEIRLNTHEKIRLSFAFMKPPDPISHVCSLTGKCISRKHFIYRPVQIFKNYVPEIFVLQNLILCTRSCVTGFITQSGWDFHVHQTTLVLWK